MHTAIRATALAPPQLTAPRSRWLIFALNGLVLVGLVAAVFTIQPESTNMRLGTVAGETLVAPHSATYVDRAATAARKAQAVASVPPQYRSDATQARLRLSEAAAFLAGAGPILGTDQTSAQKLARLRGLLPSGVTGSAFQELPNLTPNDFKVVQTRSLALLQQAVAWRFDAAQTPTTALTLLSTVPTRVSLAQRTAIGEVLATFLFPTRVPDPTATQAKQKEAASRVSRVRNVIPAGEVIVRRGDLVTPTVMEKLTALGLQSRRAGWQDTGASLLFAVVVIVMLFWYLYAFHGAIITNARLLILVDASILVTVGAARILAPGHALLPLFLPVAAAPTFAAALIAPEACMAVAFATAVLAGWIVANSFELTTYYFLSSAAGVLAIRQVRQLKQFVVAGAYISLFAAATSLAFGLLDSTFDWVALREDLLAAAFSGFVSSTLALAGFALLSDFFGVTTTLQLLEIGQPNHPLLRRLMVRAPGTYNHSLILASMVERAAEDIGANSLVAKIGALYHDVGKTTNPHCFVENQLGIANIHDELRPEESARIIRGHVPLGLRLARQHKLPRIVQDAIAEHHGTMVISFFLHKAVRESQLDGRDVDEAFYTYPGPKPRTKETALLLLADACESAVRSSQDKSAATIEQTVRSLFTDRIQQGQLDDAPLTLGDIERARAAFCSVLNGLYHPRIEYPEPGELVVDLGQVDRRREASGRA